MDVELLEKLENTINKIISKNEEVIYNNTYELYNKVWDRIINKIENGDELIVISIKLTKYNFYNIPCYLIENKINPLYYDLNILINLLQNDNLRVRKDDNELIISTSFNELRLLIDNEKKKRLV